MNQMIKINGKKYGVEHSYDRVDFLIKNKELIELRKGEFFWTKKNIVKNILGLSKIVSFSNKINMYIFVFRLQYTNLYSQWMKSIILLNRDSS